MIVAVVGATGKTGRPLVTALCDAGHAVIAVGRDRARLAGLDPRATKAVADLEVAETAAAALASAQCVVSLAHARFAEALLAALPERCGRVVLTGSVRKFTSLPDAAADAVRTGEAAFVASGRPGVMLHPSMIYGAAEERNVNRILALFRRWPRWLPLVVPLPDGGRHFVQPLFVDDAVAAFAGAVTRPEAPGPPITVAGPEAITYAAMVRACAAALGRRAGIVAVPVRILALVARLPLPFTAAELRRGAEDKRFAIDAMRSRLGVTPRPFEEGVRLSVARNHRG